MVEQSGLWRRPFPGRGPFPHQGAHPFPLVERVAQVVCALTAMKPHLLAAFLVCSQEVFNPLLFL